MTPTTEDDIIKKAEELVNEKYDWLEKREKECKSINEKFDIDSEERAWNILKIAQLELAVLKLVEHNLK